MQLPNPFASTSVRPASSYNTDYTVKSTNNNTINPGPGLPQAHSVDYSSYSIKAQADQRNHKSKNYGQFNGNRSTFGQQYLPFSCDRCDRSFRTKDLLDAHISEHVTCGIDGCQFIAHPKVVQKHIELQHETGLALRIMKLTSPEEIAKWREERKRNFPSAENIARKMEIQKEKIERGEIVNTCNDRKFSKKRCNHRGRGRGIGKVGFGKSRNTINDSNDIPSVPTVKKVAPKVDTVKTEKVLSEGEIDSEEDNNATDTVGVKVEPTSGNALASLMDVYASDSDQEDSPAKRPALMENAIAPMSEAKASEGNSPAPAKEKVERGSARRPKNRGAGKSPGKNSIKNTKTNLVRPRRLTLLQKLLQSEIVHERNVILQCVHYIVQQNFFGIGQPKAATL